jgi:hypothetical protein
MPCGGQGAHFPISGARSMPWGPAPSGRAIRGDRSPSAAPARTMIITVNPGPTAATEGSATWTSQAIGAFHADGDPGTCSDGASDRRYDVRGKAGISGQDLYGCAASPAAIAAQPRPDDEHMQMIKAEPMTQTLLRGRLLSFVRAPAEPDRHRELPLRERRRTADRKRPDRRLRPLCRGQDEAPPIRRRSTIARI